METETRVMLPWAERAADILKTKERSWFWLARRLGISRQTLSLSVLGRRPLSSEEQQKIALILEVPESLLFRD